MNPPWLTEEDVIRLLPMSEAIRLVRESFLALADGTAFHQPRRRMALPGGTIVHQMAGAFGKYCGTKVYATNVRHGANFLVQLHDAETGRLLAVMGANHLGQIRTGAASGVATDWLARPEADVLAVIGSGFQARTQVEAVMAVRPIREVRVWSRNADRRTAFAAGVERDFEVPCHAPESAEEAVRGAAIVVTATFAKDPVLESGWVADGAHVNAMGSNQAQRRELPPSLLERAELIAVDALDTAAIESGDLLLAWPVAEWEDRGVVELGRVAAQGRRSAEGVTVFKSNGLGVQDIAVAGFVWEQWKRGAQAGAPL